MNNFYNLEPIRVTFFGDSICVGQGVSIFRGWVTKIAQTLDEYGASIGRQIVVTNASVNGRTTRQALEEMPYSVQSHGVDILIVQFGLNDCNYWATDKGLPRVSPGAFKENLREIISRGFKFGAYKILLNNNHPTSLSSDFFPNTSLCYEESNRLYCNEIRALALESQENVLFQDIYTYFKNTIISLDNPLDNFLLTDKLHLSVEGHNVYYKLMYPIIYKTINEFLSETC